jgi:uncharacterized protein
MMKDAPYMALSSKGDAAFPSRNPHRPSFVTLKEVTTLGMDLGEDRIKKMDEQGIQMQVLSHGAPGSSG